MKGILEGGGATSSTRVAMLICVGTACVISVCGVWFKTDLGGLTTLVTSLLVPAFGAKVWQKGKE